MARRWQARVKRWRVPIPAGRTRQHSRMAMVPAVSGPVVGIGHEARPARPAWRLAARACWARPRKRHTSCARSGAMSDAAAPAPRLHATHRCPARGDCGRACRRACSPRIESSARGLMPGTPGGHRFSQIKWACRRVRPPSGSVLSVNMARSPMLPFEGRVSSGLWSLVCGPWSLVHGRWWCLVHGP